MSEFLGATVSITDVYPDTVRVRADELRAGDVIFDVYGGRHTLDSVRHNLRNTRTRRDDGWVDHWEHAQTLTIVTQAGVSS